MEVLDCRWLTSWVVFAYRVPTMSQAIPSCFASGFGVRKIGSLEMLLQLKMSMKPFASTFIVSGLANAGERCQTANEGTLSGLASLSGMMSSGVVISPRRVIGGPGECRGPRGPVTRHARISHGKVGRADVTMNLTRP